VYAVNKISKKLLITAVISAVLIAVVITGFVLFALNDMTPTDTKIVQVLDKNEESLLSIEGVVGAGIARDENNHIIGIAVYVEDDMSDFQGIPSKLNGFQVFIKRLSEASEFEKENMIIHEH
jgi:hypothetical protein